MAITVEKAGRSGYVEWYKENRRISSMLFDMLTMQAYESRPIGLRHPVRFYEGHIPAFSYITLVKGALGGPAIDDYHERLFYRGIDPSSVDTAAKSAPPTWPARETVRALAAQWDAAVLKALEGAERDPASQSAHSKEAVYTVLEHEPMHHETLLYMMHRVPYDQKRRPQGTAMTSGDGPLPAHERISIPAGAATLGANPEDVSFGWDNEFRQLRVDVAAFEIDKYPVTNADYLKFVEDGGPPPSFWVRRTGEWRQSAMFEEIPLRLSWPAYASQEQAAAYAAWRGMRLMTEPEFHRAAYATPSGEERLQPWGDSPPTVDRGNFGFARWDPVAVGSYPSGDSAWGIAELVGNGWEWTSTRFGPLPGFERMISYPGYSADFFDNDHYVVKGASAVTALDLIRRSFRNWYRPNYPYIYAKFRCVM